MNFSALAIRNPVVVIMLFLLVTLAGVLSFRSTVIQDFPDVELPIVTVTATLDGAAPAQLETEVARKLEDSIATLQGVKHIYTTVRDGDVTMVVEFVIEKNTAEAVTDVRDAVAKVRSELPADVKEPSVVKATVADRSIATFTAASTQLDEQEVSWFIDNTVTKKLLTVRGVGQVKRVGGVTREVLVELDAAKMAALKVTAIEVSQRLKQVQQEAPGGRGDVSGAEQSVRTIATVQSAAELAAVEIPLADGRRVRLEEVARITDTIAERRSVALQDGKRVIGVEVFRSKGASEIDVMNAARKAIDELAAEHPNVTLTQVIDNATPVQENFDGSMQLLYE
ncbi:MAG TPA: efflux RND transporter permease subunit, partial [Burkholderiaceae bacterium]|nr:efflux RND transporter permease subunit [Burkholderiaceae bacterium]